MTEGNKGRSEGRTMARRAGIVAVFTLLSRILGFVRDTTLGHIFGAEGVHDAYIMASTVPNFMRRLVAEGSLMIAFIPLLSEEKKRGGLDAMRAFTAATMAVLIPILLVLIAVGMLFPEQAVKLFAAGFEDERAALTADLTVIMMGFLGFISLTALASGVLNTQGRFAAPAAAPILLNVAIIVAAIVFRHLFEVPVEAVAWGFLVGGALQLALQLPFLAKEGMIVAPRLDLKHPTLRTLGRRMLPAVFGVAVYQINILIIRQIASFLPEGDLSCYFWATRLQEFALGVFAVSISIAALPTLSEHAANKDVDKLLATFNRALRATNFVTVPATTIMVVAATPIVGVLFRHGRVTAQAGATTAELVLLMATALVPIGAVRVMVPTYYALGDTKTPVAAALASMVTTGAVGWWSMDRYGIHGLTIATVLAALAQVVVLGALLKARVRTTVGERSEPKKGPSVAVHALKCFVAVLPGAVLAGWAAQTRGWLGGDNLVGALWLAGIFGFAIPVYFGLAKVLRIEEGTLILGAVLRRARRST
ncbi:MAG: murein biosynthesis integral membrane protein MurJ [Deltaproteobacteria bacterium]|jgi:putative peptidoglycan lipid II flippase